MPRGIDLSRPNIFHVPCVLQEIGALGPQPKKGNMGRQNHQNHKIYWKSDVLRIMESGAQLITRVASGE